jgi:hypothetical protein
MDLSVIFQRAFVAQWNFPLILESIKPEQDIWKNLLVADEGSYVSTWSCTAPSRDENQLHAAVVE